MIYTFRLQKHSMRLITIPTITLLIALLMQVSLFAERPNVVLIISDDHAWTDYRFTGNEKIQSPHIDKLAEEGLTYTRGYVTTGLCSPSLATMLTGLHTHEHGITGNDPVRGKDREVWLDRFFENPMLPKMLADAGYNTMHTGKYWMRKPSAAGFTHDIGETGRHGGKSLSIGRKTMKSPENLTSPLESVGARPRSTIRSFALEFSGSTA